MEALDKASREPRIDLLLTDVVLPEGMTGLHVASELARQRPGLRVLFASGYSKDILDVEGESADRQLIAEPCDRLQLAKAVRAALGQSP